MKDSDRRDQQIGRLLQQSLKAPGAQKADDCLDAEIIAAWIDGGLSGLALQRAEMHVAGCARCQAIVGATIGSEPVVPVETPAASWRWRGWLVPLTAATAALVVWVVLPRPEPPVPPAQLSARLESAESRPPDNAPAEAKRVDPSPSQGGRVGDQNTEVRERADARAKANDALAVGTLRRAEVPAAEASAVRPPPAAPDPAVPGRSPVVDVQGAAAGRIAPAAAASANSAAPLERSALADAEPPVVAAPDSRVRWRLLGGSTIQRSEDAGAAWTAVFSEPTIMLTSGSAPSATICWFVGRGGAVVRSVDGRTFARVPFPNTLHLATIRATDAQTASATTVAGQLFTTTDGGTTWREP